MAGKRRVFRVLRITVIDYGIETVCQYRLPIRRRRRRCHSIGDARPNSRLTVLLYATEKRATFNRRTPASRLHNTVTATPGNIFALPLCYMNIYRIQFHIEIVLDFQIE